MGTQCCGPLTERRARSRREKVAAVGKYFGHQPRYSQEEAEAQAKAAIDAAVSQGRPPAEDWKELGSRMGDLSAALAARPPVDIPSPPPRRAASEQRTSVRRPPRAMNEILRPQTDPAPVPAPAPPRRPAPAAPVAAAAPAKRARSASKATSIPAAPQGSATVAKPAPTKRAPRAAAPTAGVPTKRPSRTTGVPAPVAAKRPAAKKRPG